MRLPDLKYNFTTLSPQQQYTVFTDYWHQRQKDLETPPPSRQRTTVFTVRKPKEKAIVLSPQQIELLKKLNILQ